LVKPSRCMALIAVDTWASWVSQCRHS
jgi:hypothetical protein